MLPSTSCCVTVHFSYPVVATYNRDESDSSDRSNSRARRAAPFTFCDGVRTGHQQYSDWYKRARAGLGDSETRAQMHQMRTQAAPPFTSARAVPHPTQQLTTRVLRGPVCACVQHQTSQLTRSRAASVGPRRREAHLWRYHSTTTLRPTNKALQTHDKSPARTLHSNALCIPGHHGKRRIDSMQSLNVSGSPTQTADSAD